MADNAEVEEQVVARVRLVLQVGGVAGDLVAQSVHRDGLLLHLVLGYDESGQAVEGLLAQDVGRPLAADDVTLVGVELGQENAPDGAHLPTPLVLGHFLSLQTQSIYIHK